MMVRRVVDQRWSLANAAAAVGVSERTCAKWVRRYRSEGAAGLLDRSSVPLSVPHRTTEDRVQAIAALRRLRMTGAEIAMVLRMAPSTVSAVCCGSGWAS
jgi:transposase-like protein